MDRFNGYNRNDFHYARTSREAFGSNFYTEEKSHFFRDLAYWVVFFVLLAVISKLI